ncbi:MAG: MATE family efflux transporter [Lachnospiraceae bacterium]|nr:MATE family efflux transporter [Lachnospiraceae bacterium]
MAGRLSAKQMNMTEGPIAGKFLIFCLPIVLTGMLQLLFNAADIIVVGQFVDETAVAAVGSTSFLINLSVNLFIGIATGVTALISTEIGRGDFAQVRKSAHTAVALGIIFGVFVMVVGFLGAPTFLRLMQTPADVIDQATLYLKIYFCGTPFFMVYSFGRAVLITTGDTRRPLYYLSGAGVFNVLFNILLVTQFDFGVAGVAIATISAQMISAVLVMHRLYVIDGPCHVDLRHLLIDPRAVREILHLGMPSGIQSVLFSVSNVMIQSSVNSLGTSYVSANATAGSIEGFVWIAMNGFDQGAMTFIGQNYGAGKVERFNRIYAIATGYCIAIGLGLGMLVMAARVPLTMFYLPDAPKAVQIASDRLVIFMLTYWMCGTMNVACACARGMNRPMVPMIATLIGVCALRVLWILWGFGAVREQLGSDAAYTSLVLTYPASWILTGAFVIWYYVHIRNMLARKLAAGETASI